MREVRPIAEVFFPASQDVDQEKAFATNCVLLKGKLVPVYISLNAIPERPWRDSPPYIFYQPLVKILHRHVFLDAEPERTDGEHSPIKDTYWMPFLESPF